MAGPVLADCVIEWTLTTGVVRPYVLGGTFGGNRTFLDVVPDGDWFYFEAADLSARMEHGTARFDAPNLVTPLTYEFTTNGGNPVNWPAGLRPIISVMPHPGEVLASIIAEVGGGVVGGGTTVVASPATGATITLSASDRVLDLSPATTIATLSIVMPPTPGNGQVLEINTSNTITDLTVTAPGGATVTGGVQMLVADGGMSWRYRASDLVWRRRY